MPTLHAAYLDGRVRCLELQFATLAGLHDAWQAVAGGIPRRQVAALIADRLALLTSVAWEVCEAVEDCRGAGVAVDTLAFLELLAGCNKRLARVAGDGIDASKARSAVMDARFAVLAARQREAA